MAQVGIALAPVAKGQWIKTTSSSIFFFSPPSHITLLNKIKITQGKFFHCQRIT
jgi:hypothetical protein